MTPSLRMRVVEAGARAIDDEIGGEMREHLGHVLRKWPNTIESLSEAVLDAFLSCLSENADETIHPKYNDEPNPWRLFDASVEDLLAVLRNPE